VENFHLVLQEHTAGSPEEELVWTDLTLTDIADRLSQQGTPVSYHIVLQLLEQEGFHQRQAQKSCSLGENPDRNDQFLNIARLKQEFFDSGNPILSIDTKKRELIGNFFRYGALWTRQTQRTFDHDFPSFADGVVIPHGLYDLRLNRGYIHLGTSYDTSEFACDGLRDWRQSFGQEDYPRATELLLLCDGGGSNSASTSLFKVDLQALVNEWGMPVRVAHYPAYCSKYNPIEHRLFCHLSRACRGVILTSVSLVKQLMEKARTRTGLQVVVEVLNKVYQKGRKIAEEVKESLNLVRDTFLPKWNYRILPQN
jgi:Rhodopirellula transposase DDE domain